MKKKWLKLLLLVFLSTLIIANATKAEVGGPGGLPEADDPFWEVMAQLDRPDDATCESKAEVILTAAGLPGGAERAQLTCDAVELITDTMPVALAEEGVSTNLFDQSNWHNIEGLYFDDSDGRIEFTEDIDFMSRNFMILLQTLVQRLDIESEEIEFDAGVVGGLRDIGAILTMRNVSEYSSPAILVNGDEDTNGVVSGLVYDRETDTITFNAAHFTKFKAVERSSIAEKPKFTKVKMWKYKNSAGKTKIKVKISGKKFKKNARVKLGKKYASEVNFKNSKRLTATFTYDKVLEKSGKDVYLKVVNSSTRSNKYKNKFNLEGLETMSD